MRKNLPRYYQRPGVPANQDISPAVEYVLSPETEEPGFRDYWKMLVKRRRLIILTFLVVFSFGAFTTFRTTPRYTASTILRIEPHTTPVIGVGDVVASADEYFQTQIALLKSRALAARVVKDLALQG